MQIVININDKVYGLLRYFEKGLGLNDKEDDSDDVKTALMRAVINGTPLPKGHGRLIDADEYKEHLYACETNGRPLHIMELDERLATVDDAPTIIEADKENEDE